ncbi:hypothetical protein P879_03266 [Paragonimus westermani]|uniref:Gamma-glutamyltranspeptidase / glutathione hydrolase n=1 Tax=Paragonimus westermani TaxID=34504 RepID=A0A8T0CZ69_9TREM|nr:hypothetical protein P879_03266 [Paragonimus westermani]
MPAGDTETILEPIPSPSQKDGVQNNAFVPEDTSVDTGKDIPQTMKGSPKLWKWRLEGMTLVVLSVVVLSAAITVALIICVFAGPSQVQPHGAVASESGYCNRFGLELMEQDDGNAVDSAVATALCLAVVRPDVASLAGCGMMLVKNRNTQHSHLYDFMCPAPSNPPAVDLNSPGTLVGVPGFLKGLRLAHSQFGKRPWADLVRGASYAAANGFQPDTALVEAAKAVKSSNPSGAGTIVDSLVTLSGGIYTPPSALKEVLRALAERGSETFYSGGTDSTSFANRLLSFMVGWQAKDLNDYKVNQPKPIQMGFAGFTLEAFPAPSSGGPFLLSLLGNTDLKNAVAPLNRKALAENDVNATATVLHRLLEFSKAAEASVLALGDISDSSIADEATRLQNQLFSPTSRKALVNSVDDFGTLPVNDSLQRESDVAIGDTGIVTTDSAYLTVVMNLFLGAPFGSGLVVPNTGVHLNAALRLFSNATLVNSSKPVLNTIASGRRPLVPVSPVYLSTTQRKCGIRVGVTSSGGIWGSLDSAQVVANAALFLRNSKCRRPENANPPAAAMESSGIVLVPSASNPPTTSNQYTPATEEGCINPQYATDLARFHCGTVVRLSNATNFPVYVEPNFSKDLSVRLEAVGHAVQTYSPMWPGRVALAGWNGYTMISSIDGRGSWDLQTY